MSRSPGRSFASRLGSPGRAARHTSPGRLGSPSPFARDLDGERQESQRLRSLLADKDLLISTLKAERDSFPTMRLNAEISNFAQFAQSTLRRLTDAEAVTAKERRLFEASVHRFSAVSSVDHPRTKVTQFFAEAQAFCDLLAEKVLQVDAGVDEVPSAGLLLHDSEMQRLKTQNQLYRAERRLDEVNEEAQTLGDQMRIEHQLISQLSAKVFPGVPVVEDRQFVRKEVRRLEAEFEDNRRLLSELRLVKSQIESAVSEFSGTHRLPLSGDAATDVERALNFADTTISTDQDALEKVAAALKLTSTDGDTLTFEIRRLQKSQGELEDTKRTMLTLRRENQDMNREIESLVHVSAETQRQTTENSVLLDRVSQYKRQVTELTSDASRLRQTNASLTVQNETLLSEKIAAERTAAKSAQELADVRLQLQVATRKATDLAKQSSQLRSDHSDVATEKILLNDKVQSLTEQLRAANSENRVKSSTIDSLTSSLESARARIAELSAQVGRSDAEIERLKSIESRLRSLSKENETFLTELHKKSSEIASLSPLKHRVEKSDARNSELRQSLSTVQDALEVSRQKVSRLKARLADQEATIHELREEAADNAQLKAAKDRLEATVASLTGRTDALRSQVATLNVSADRASQLQKTLSETQDRLRQTLADNRDLTEQVDALTADTGRLIAENETLREISESFDALRTSAKAVKKENRSLNDDLTTVEDQNRSLASQIETLTDQVSTLRTRLSEAERQNRKLTKDNADLRSIVDSTSSRIESKSSALQNLSSQLEALQATIRQERATIAELEATKRSLQTQIETKSTIIQNNESRIRALRESNQALAGHQPLTRSLEREISRLTTENRDLQQKLLQSTQLAETARSASALLDRRSAAVDELNSQIRTLRAEKEHLLARNARLDEQLRSSEGELRELRATRSLIAEENAELSMKMSDLEDDHRESRTALIRKNAELTETVTQLQQEKRRLTQQIDALSDAEGERRVLRREVKQLRKENLDLAVRTSPRSPR
jgi:chromosome segregation ATPase